jgi:hypothetical protein
VDSKLSISKDIKFHFRTIGMGTINYRQGARRLAGEASSTGLFSSSLGHDEEFLVNSCKTFWKDHQTILKARVPGFGWWLWKPTYIRTVLQSLPENDVLMYLDAGSQIGQKKDDLNSILQYLELARKNDVVGSNNQPFVEEFYSSLDYLDLLELETPHRMSAQFYAGFLIVKNSERGRQLVSEWEEYSCKMNHRYFFIDESAKREIPGFVHHMYDQALLSPLLKKYEASNIEVGDKSIEAPIRMLRHRYAFSVSETNHLIVAFYQTIAFLSRVNLAIQRRIFRNTLNLRPHRHD